MSRKGNMSLEITIDHDISMQKSHPPQPAFSKIFITLLKESHMIGSIIYETLRPFPRFLRTILLFTEFYTQLFFSCFFVCLWGTVKGIDFICFWVVFLSQVLTTILGNFNRTSSKKLEKAKNTEEFIEISKAIEKKIRVKWVCVIVVCLAIICASCAYTVVFFAKHSSEDKTNAMIIFLVSVTLDILFFQVLEALAMAGIKSLSYNSRILKKLNILLKKIRIWKSTNPDLDR